MSNVQIKEEINVDEHCDISRTIQRNVSNYFMLFAVSLFLMCSIKKRVARLYSVSLYMSLDDTGRKIFD